MTNKEATAKLHAKLAGAGFKRFARGTWWETEEQNICVLLTEGHNDVFFFADKSFRLQYTTRELLLDDFDTLMGIETEDDEDGDDD